MGLWSAASIGVGAMIGAGLFALIGIVTAITGKYAVLAFLIAGFIALLTTYSVSKLSVTFPSKGGRVEYLNQAFGKGVLSGGLNIIMWVGYVIVTSLYARAFGEYGIALLSLNSELWLHLLSSGIVFLFLFINFSGAKVVGKSELLIVAVKVLALVFFAAVGLYAAEPGKWMPENSLNLGNLLLASGVVFMSYEGFGLVANTAEDIKNPQKNLPRALFISVFIVMIIYLLVNLAVFGNISPDRVIEAKEYALAEAAKPFLGQAGFTVMGIAALFSTASAINATIYGPVHMLQETAKAKQIPKFLTRKLWGHESGRALLLTGITILVTANLLDLEAIAETGSLIFLIIYAMVNVANFKLRAKTNSRGWIIICGFVGTFLAFGSLLYYQVRKEAISVYMLLIFSAIAFGYQLFRLRRPGND